MPAPARLPALVLATLCLDGGCASNPTVSFEVVLPANVSSTAEWLEVGVVSGACPPTAELAGGLPISGVLDRVAFQKGDVNPPAIGSIPKGAYGFVAAARAADCSVVAAGCASANVTDARDVTITMTATSPPVGSCEAGSTCMDARCVPSLTGSNPALGAGCSLALVGAGPLGDPLSAAVDVVSAPAAAATENGFLVAYREYDQMGGMAQLTLLAIQNIGGSTVSQPLALPQQCANSDETDSVGLGYTAGAGVVVSARPACASSPGGFDTWQVDSMGNTTNPTFSPTTTGSPMLSNAHALALTGAMSGWIAYLQDGTSNVIALSGLSTSGSPIAFGGSASGSLAQIATTAQAVALLSGGIGGGSDASAGPPSLGLSLGTAPGKTAAPVVFPGDWGAVALQGSRAIVLSDSTTATQPLAWSAFDPSVSSPPTGTFAAPAQGTVSGGDVVMQGDHALFAVEQPAAISLVAFDHASTTPTPLRSVILANDPRIPSQAHVADGKVAVAASSTQVLVTWVTETILGVDDAVGGWALYACSP